MNSRYWGLGVFILFGAAAFAGCSSEQNPVPANLPAGPQHSAPADEADPAAAMASPPATPADPQHPHVEIETSLGTMTVELDAENAPGTVTNFLEYVNSGHYNQTVFHFVARDSMIVGGGFDAQLAPKTASLPIRNEAHNGLNNTRGTLAMSRPAELIDGATNQFFINLSDNPGLDHRDTTPEGYGYCVFGQVIAGLDVADRIGNVATHDHGEFVSTPQESVIIRTIRQVR